MDIKASDVKKDKHVDLSPLNYVETDYSKLTEEDFKKTVMKYALFKYMSENGLLNLNEE